MALVSQSRILLPAALVLALGAWTKTKSPLAFDIIEDRGR